jgi:hypothetical protein
MDSLAVESNMTIPELHSLIGAVANVIAAS